MRSMFLKAEGNLDVDEFLAKVKPIQMGSSQTKRDKCNLSIIAVEFFVPTLTWGHHNLEDSYRPVFVLINNL